jgi:DNA-binding transcriptional ArsR family regulator
METNAIIASLAALAQESRLAAYRLLVAAGPAGLSVGEIGADLEIAPATLSFHLKELANAGLVVARQEGRYIYYSANFERMDALIAYLTDHCCSRGTCCGPTECAPPAKRAASPARARCATPPTRRAKRGAIKT